MNQTKIRRSRWGQSTLCA